MRVRRTQVFKESWARKEDKRHAYPDKYSKLPGEDRAIRDAASEKTYVQAQRWFWSMVALEIKDGYTHNK